MSGIRANTRLERFMRKHEIPSNVLETEGMPRSQLLRYRKGEDSPNVKTARRIVKGFNAKGYQCKANDLFELDDEDKVS